MNNNIDSLYALNESPLIVTQYSRQVPELLVDTYFRPYYKRVVHLTLYSQPQIEGHCGNQVAMFEFVQREFVEDNGNRAYTLRVRLPGAADYTIPITRDEWQPFWDLGDSDVFEHDYYQYEVFTQPLKELVTQFGTSA